MTSATPSHAVRKTRFVCVSDTHNASPDSGAFKLPKGDVLIHAGDLTKQGTYGELRRTLDWIEKADFELKIVIAGNHDVTLDEGFYTEHGISFHNQSLQSSQQCIEMFHSSPVVYLNHEARTLKLESDKGPRTIFNIFGSPYSPAKGLWAFGYRPEAAAALWEQIPIDADVVVTHTPPKNHCDGNASRASAGCESLRQNLWRVRPRLALCGHVHEGRGSERVSWDLTGSKRMYAEISTDHWVDPASESKRQCLLDLTSNGSAPVRNQSDGKLKPFSHTSAQWKRKISFAEASPPDPIVAHERQSGFLPSSCCDFKVQESRLDRQETCVVNAAIMASSWPYKDKGGRKYNKPFVIDVDLPIWESIA